MPGVGVGVGLDSILFSRVGGGGGPPVPDWVEALRAPDNRLPQVVWDFESTRYWRADIGVCTVDDVTAYDENWGPWDPENIVPGIGLTYYVGGFTGLNPILTAAAFALVGKRFTVTVIADLQNDQDWVNGGVEIDAVNLPDYTDAAGVYFLGHPIEYPTPGSSYAYSYTNEDGNYQGLDELITKSVSSIGDIVASSSDGEPANTVARVDSPETATAIGMYLYNTNAPVGGVGNVVKLVAWYAGETAPELLPDFPDPLA